MINQPGTVSRSIFDAECPHCGIALQPLGEGQPVDGWLWECPSCGLVAERAGRLLLPSPMPVSGTRHETTT